MTKLARPELRCLIEKVIADLGEDFCHDPKGLGYFLVIEPGDTLADIHAHIGFDILANRYTGIRFDQPGYTPSFEVLEEHAGYYEMVFIVSDDGFGIEVFIPKTIDIAELLAMCQRYATPASSAVPAAPAIAGAT